MIGEVASAYKERRLTVINLMYEELASDAVSFSEAFKITKRG